MTASIYGAEQSGNRDVYFKVRAISGSGFGQIAGIKLQRGDEATDIYTDWEISNDLGILKFLARDSIIGPVTKVRIAPNYDDTTLTVDGGATGLGVSGHEYGIRALTGSTGAAGFFNDGVESTYLAATLSPMGSTTNYGVYTSGRIFTTEGIQLNTVRSKPTCKSVTRGLLWYTLGGAAKDTLEVCAKDAADVYAWRTLW